MAVVMLTCSKCSLESLVIYYMKEKQTYITEELYHELVTLLVLRVSA